MTAVVPAPWAAATQRVIGTFLHLLVTEPDLLPAAEALCAAELAALDLACSRFREDSELARLPTDGRTVLVSALLAEAVSAALDVAASTDGLVDPTLGAALVAAGYDRTFADLPADGPAAVCLPAPRNRWREVLVVDGCALSVPAGVRLDLGSSAKAWAADRIAAKVAALGTGVLVNLGGDLALGGTAPEGGWPVAIADRQDGRSVQTVALEQGGLATSSTTARTWRRGGQALHHILDPATGRPAPPRWAAVTVAASSCLDANAASTAAVVLGNRAPSWLEARDLPACLIGRYGDVLRLSGWPEEP